MKVTRKSRHQKILTATRRRAHIAIDKGVRAGLEVMNQRAPVRTGYLRSRNSGETDGQGHGKHENDTPYAFFQEFGTSRMAAQSFFRPGRDRARRVIKQEMKIVDR